MVQKGLEMEKLGSIGVWRSSASGMSMASFVHTVLQNCTHAPFRHRFLAQLISFPVPT